MAETMMTPDSTENIRPEDAITMTPEAVAQARKMLARKHPDNPQMSFRMGVRGGGCSGYSYVLEFDDQATRWDLVFTVDSVRILVDRKSFQFLKGTVVRWSGNLMSGGFEFDNPNVSKSCGCGTSFSM